MIELGLCLSISKKNFNDFKIARNCVGRNMTLQLYNFITLEKLLFNRGCFPLIYTNFYATKL